eukprot:4932333-Amphidinium_carterae.2
MTLTLPHSHICRAKSRESLKDGDYASTQSVEAVQTRDDPQTLPRAQLSGLCVCWMAVMGACDRCSSAQRREVRCCERAHPNRADQRGWAVKHSDRKVL